MNTTKTPVAVIGLGAMGSALAQTLIGAGCPTTVFNRTPSKAEPLVSRGATAATSAADAARASSLVIICVLDQQAVTETLDAIGESARGCVLVNLTSGTAKQARTAARWAADHGAEYIDGGIMCDPPDIGTHRANLVYSGSPTAFEAHRNTLERLGNTTYFGEEPGRAAVFFLGEVGLWYEILIGFLHTLHAVRNAGIAAEAFAEHAAKSLEALPGLLTMVAANVDRGEYPRDLGPLRVQQALMEDLMHSRRSEGADTARMVEINDLMERRIADGGGEGGFAGVFELIANPCRERAVEVSGDRTTL